MPDIVFACLVSGEKGASRAHLLKESLRAFGGDFSASPVWVLVPESSDGLLQQVAAKFHLQLFPFEIEPQVMSFPFAARAVAAAAAESLAEGHFTQLVWMDSGSLVVNPPHDLVLENGIKLACRPVDHLLIGSPYQEPIDQFWAAVYQACDAKQENLLPMRTSADQIQIRPYINAGMLVLPPEQRLLRLWRDRFLEIYQQPHFQQFYSQDHLYRIFIHQAVLAGCILGTLQQEEIFELPYRVNYPLHMHSQYPSHLRPQSMNELVSLRYEEFFTDPNWQDQIRVEGILKDWLSEHLSILAAV